MKRFFILIAGVLLMLSCEKQDKWLDVKSNKSDVVPSTLKDYQAILDYDVRVNEAGPSLGTISADNYYITDAVWSAAPDATQRNAYIWAKDIFEGGSSFDWRNGYQRIGYANIVLDGLKKFDSNTEPSIYNDIKGNALFLRGLSLFGLAQQFAKPYDNATADGDLGVVIKLTSAVQEKISRASLKQTYNQIINDLVEANNLLPVTPAHKTRASKPSALTLLANVYLVMGDYKNALRFANDALVYNSELLDFNTLNSTLAFPLPNYQAKNPEILYYSTASLITILTSSRLIVSPDLYQQYETNDLRKPVFFNKAIPAEIKFKGYYSGQNSAIFCGLATNELLLIIAECEARNGNKESAMNAVNKLLIKRYKTGTFIPLTAINADDALVKILRERNKELPFTGITRWMDLRRLNKEPRFAITLARTLKGVVYSLPPNDPRYVFPIPDDEIRLTGIEQNIR